MLGTAIAQRSFDATISALDAETSAIARSYRRYRRGVLGDCGVGITPQMCNRVTNHGDMGTFSKPDLSQPLRADYIFPSSLFGLSHLMIHL